MPQPLYPNLLPLPTRERPKMKAVIAKGQVSVSAYDGRVLESGWKKRS